jgi:hypothetical protein
MTPISPPRHNAMPTIIRAPMPLWPKTFRIVRIGSHGCVAIPLATATVAQPTKNAATISIWPKSTLRERNYNGRVHSGGRL